MFKKANTVNYPDEKVPVFPKYRGKQVLMRDENGLEKCVACGLCAVACPADAIYLEPAENDGTVQAGSALRVDLSDSQDALHLLRLLRRGLPGVRDLHGQGLRARRLQQQGLHLGQGGPARPAPHGAAAAAEAAHRIRPAPVKRSPFSTPSSQRVLVCDGAMGTMLYARGIFLNRCFDELNLTQPDLVAEVHREYVRAGADVIETNTFGANRFKLANFGLADKTRAINLQGARIARHAAREARVGRRIDRSARRAHRAVGPDGRRRSRSRVSRAGGGARRGRRRSVHPRDVPRPERDQRPRFAPCAASPTLPIVAQMTTERRRQQPRRHAAARRSRRSSSARAPT